MEQGSSHAGRDSHWQKLKLLPVVSGQRSENVSVAGRRTGRPKTVQSDQPASPQHTSRGPLLELLATVTVRAHAKDRAHSRRGTCTAEGSGQCQKLQSSHMIEYVIRFLMYLRVF